MSNVWRDFADELASWTASDHACNQYAGADGVVQRRNLALYLEHMSARRPSRLLIGEAPGYRGCRVTGIPFTSAAILRQNPSPFGLFDDHAAYHIPDGNAWPVREATATVVWETLTDLRELPLLWNAFPYHPHRPRVPASNRAPSCAELAVGRRSLLRLLERFPIAEVIAVGNVAAAALVRWSIPARKVRHPGHGGKAAFRRELAVALGLEFPEAGLRDSSG